MHTDPTDRRPRRAATTLWRAALWSVLALALGLWIVHPAIHAHGMPADKAPHCALNLLGTTATPTITPPPAVEPLAAPTVLLPPAADQWIAPRIAAASPASPRAPPSA
jgi:hypothetical protein